MVLMKMKARRPNRLASSSMSISMGILLGAAALIAAPARSLVGFAHRNQDPSPPSVSFVPDNLDFGNQVVRRSSATRKVVVKNTGGQPLSIDSVDLGGDNPNSFAILNDTCTGATVAPNRACVVEVNFTPSGTGERNARLKLTDNAFDSPQRVRLKGNGINPIDVAPF
jgi:hypothetical protein